MCREDRVADVPTSECQVLVELESDGRAADDLVTNPCDQKGRTHQLRWDVDPAPVPLGPLDEVRPWLVETVAKEEAVAASAQFLMSKASRSFIVHTQRAEADRSSHLIEHARAAPVANRGAPALGGAPLALVGGLRQPQQVSAAPHLDVKKTNDDGKDGCNLTGGTTLAKGSATAFELLAVLHDVDDGAVWCSYEEPANIPLLGRQRMHDLAPERRRLCMGTINVVCEDGDHRHLGCSCIVGHELEVRTVSGEV